MANRRTWRYAAALSELGQGFLNRRWRSVNRKVRSSNLRPGATLRLQVRLLGDKTPSAPVRQTFGWIRYTYFGTYATLPGHQGDEPGANFVCVTEGCPPTPRAWSTALDACPFSTSC